MNLNLVNLTENNISLSPFINCKKGKRGLDVGQSNQSICCDCSYVLIFSPGLPRMGSRTIGHTESIFPLELTEHLHGSVHVRSNNCLLQLKTLT